MRIQVNDRVMYSKRFLQSTGQYTGDIPFAKGTVTEIRELGSEMKLAIVDWDNPEIPSKVNVMNLVRLQDICKEPV